MASIAIKRVYEPPAAGDGFRVLVDRVWPRGISKEKAKLDLWVREIAPSTELRKWFAHDPAKWAEFQKRYRKELEDRTDALRELLEKQGKRTMTLVYGAHDAAHNQAVVLKRVLEETAAQGA